MIHRCRVTVIDAMCFEDIQERYLADPRSGPCPCYHKGDEFLFLRDSGRDDFWGCGKGTLVHTDHDPSQTAGGPDRPFCSEAWDAIGRYIYTALQGGSIMHGWTNDDRMMIACCSDGTRPVVFRIERIDIPEDEEEAAWLERQDFANRPEDAITGSDA